MKLLKIEIENYKSFGEPQSVEFNESISIIVGENSAGKTSMLEAISGKFVNRPHIAEWMQYPDTAAPESKVLYRFTVGVGDLCRSWERMHIFPALMFPSELYAEGYSKEQWISDFNNLGAVFEFRRTGGDVLSTEIPPFMKPANFLGRRFDPSRGNELIWLNLDRSSRTVAIRAEQYPSFTHPDEHFARIFLSEIYVFRADRLSFQPCRIGNSTVLSADANNLAEILLNLQSKKYHFNEYCNLVRYILPNIRDISAKVLNSELVDVSITSIDPQIARDHHYFSLNQSGTGVGQILALIYVAFMSTDSRVIVIDEPNSFLHPGATRRLIEVCKRFSRHQFIFSTHAPEVISLCRNSTIIALRWVHDHSEIIQDTSENDKFLRIAMDSVDLKLADVFGYESIVWVEGPTEEKCFPLIIEFFMSGATAPVAFIQVSNTGDFDARQRDIAIEAHRRMAEGSALLPRTVGFILDREARSPEKLEAMRITGPAKWVFTKRRNYECYILEPSAIAFAFNKGREKVDGVKIVTKQDVEEWLVRNGTDSRWYAGKADVPVRSEEWFRSVDGAKLLKALFNEIDEIPENYQKTAHSVWATELILQEDPEILRELRDIILEAADISI